MRHIVWAAVLVVLGLATGGCGGGSKPPMVPDAPDPAVGDAGAEVPVATPAGKK
jgi:hypothetical protein